MKQGEREEILGVLVMCAEMSRKLMMMIIDVESRPHYLQQQILGMPIEEETPDSEKEGTD